MRTFFVGFLVFTAWCAFSVYYYTCNIKNLCTPPEPVKKVVPFEISDKSNFNFKTSDNIYFNLADDVPEVEGEMNNILGEIGKYLNKEDAINLRLSGKAYKEESSKKDMDKVAMARARKIKEILMSQNVDSNKIIIAGETGSLPDARNYDKLAGMVDMSFEIDSSAIAQLKNKFVKLYFATGSNRIVLDSALIQYFKEVKIYLDQNKDAKAQLIGHTDNVGSEQINLNLGKERAETMKKKLIEIGIREEQMELSSEGEANPIADNRTVNGRSQNRRVEININ